MASPPSPDIVAAQGWGSEKCLIGLQELAARLRFCGALRASLRPPWRRSRGLTAASFRTMSPISTRSIRATLTGASLTSTAISTRADPFASRRTMLTDTEGITIRMLSSRIDDGRAPVWRGADVERRRNNRSQPRVVRAAYSCLWRQREHAPSQTSPLSTPLPHRRLD